MPRRAILVVSTLAQSAGVALLLLNVAFFSTKFALASPTTGACTLTTTKCSVTTGNPCSAPANCATVDNCLC